MNRRFAPWLFMSPALLLFTTYVLWPIAQSIWISFHTWDGVGQMEWAGLANYMEMAGDEQIVTAISNNVLWLALYLLSPPLGLMLALFLNQQIRAIRLAKSLFFFPFVINLVVVGLVFRWFYDPSYGPLNAAITALGGEAIGILANEDTATYGVIAAGLWPQTAYCMIIYLAGLSGVNREIVEAARIDGARGWRMLYHIVLPQLRPATFVVVVVTVVGALRSFDLIAIMTEGGPYGSSTVLAWEMYEQALFSYRMGYGAAIAVLLFVVMGGYIAWVLWQLARRES
ncbi:MAG: sugar ABC transporter permease [Gammaproteobacteria bacterium]|nr:sugar ABC transporter permease [Gammaproteobacteria bacterium]MDD9816230.1 sugar ABC transporter permease [Gammaproteobacteria bacterium]MDD9851858.1 sugar ABC transporter permease [Gammaproteobacteria bacterium]MDD9870946.1 sugar ABC transporter permease [Gammaproteobacteria bacterium]